MDDKDRTLKALEDMKESMAYAVRRRDTADVVTLEAQVLALTEALRPFANFACDPPCGCHNCVARAVLAKSRDK